MKVGIEGTAEGVNPEKSLAVFVVFTHCVQSYGDELFQVIHSLGFITELVAVGVPVNPKSGNGVLLLHPPH